MENRNIPYKIYLDEADMPQAWYNLRGKGTSRRCGHL